MADVRKRGLGRGLSALISSGAAADISKPSPKKPEIPAVHVPERPRAETKSPALDTAGAAEKSPAQDMRGENGHAMSDGSALIELDPHTIRQNPRQPRHEFDEETLAELAESIKREGVLEPVLVRIKNGEYQLVSGERRIKASILAERKTIPAIVRNVSDRDMLKLGLIENIQREDLNPMETAQAYEALIHEFNWTQEQLAEEVGKKRATVTNTLRLLQLEPGVQEALVNGKITMGHAKALLAFDSPVKQSAACRKIVAEGLSVRQAEKLSSAPSPQKPNESGGAERKDPHVAQIEDELRRRFGTKVHVRSNEEYRGKIEVEFFNLDDLDRILKLLRP